MSINSGIKSSTNTPGRPVSALPAATHRAPASYNRNSFEPARGEQPGWRVRDTFAAHPLQGPSMPPSSNPVVAEAERWLGKTTPQLAKGHWDNRKPDGDPFLKAYDPSTPVDASCANFVGSVLIAKGLLPPRLPYASSGDYASTEKLVPALKNQGWSEQTGVTSKNLMDPEWCRTHMKPGDVVVVGNGKFAHAMIYTGIDPKTNRPKFIGANGVAEDKDGKKVGPFSPQKVTEVGWSTIQQWMGNGNPDKDGLTISVYSPPQQ